MVFADSSEKVSIDKASYLFLQDCRIRLQRGLQVVSILFPAVGDSFEGKGGILGAVIRKLLIHGFLFTFNYINFVPEVVWKGFVACYIWGLGRGCLPFSLEPKHTHLLSAQSTSFRGLVCTMEG